MNIDELRKKPLQYLKGVGEKRSEQFARLGIFTAYDLLFHLPRAYEDWTPHSISEAEPDSVCAVKAIVSAPFAENKIRRGLTLYKGTAFDETGKLHITYFNGEYAARQLLQGEEYLFYGKVEGNRYSKQMNTPKAVKANKAPPLKAVYPGTNGLHQKTMSAVVEGLLKSIVHIEDPVPNEIVTRLELCSLDFAIRTVHFPKNREDLALAVKRLAFNELLYMELGLLSMGKKNKVTTDKVAHKCDMTPFFNSLPFKMTNAQMKAVIDGAADMLKSIPMNRLLQGDVGSGKTAVAAALIYYAAQSGFQSGMMAPTEILAEQHFDTLSRFLSPLGIKICLLTSSVKGKMRSDILNKVSTGECDLLVGTHAIIQDSVVFNNLGFVVTDEQHRFGVKQRSKLTKKGGPAHTLVMSATPIPRTLALMMYGDLDISVLDELPPGRREIRTYCVGSDARDRLDGFIERHILKGRQVYVVCPLIEGENEDSVKEHFARLSKRFPSFSVGLLHGKMKAAEKEDAMRAFSQGDINVLVSTTVIEVGVDVTNATLMIIEEADKFGLSQLHQLRGRVGRSDMQSFCVLVSDAKGQDARIRLEAMCDTTDGFEIARRDLELRGPGDFFGSRQHGLPLLKIADLHSDMDILQTAAKEAADILSRDPELNLNEHALLKEGVEALFESVNN